METEIETFAKKYAYCQQKHTRNNEHPIAVFGWLSPLLCWTVPERGLRGRHQRTGNEPKKTMIAARKNMMLWHIFLARRGHRCATWRQPGAGWEEPMPRRHRGRIYRPHYTGPLSLNNHLGQWGLEGAKHEQRVSRQFRQRAAWHQDLLAPGRIEEAQDPASCLCGTPWYYGPSLDRQKRRFSSR